MEYVIGVDIGTQSTRRCSSTGTARSSRGARPATSPIRRARWAEQWPQVWFDAVLACIAGCVSDARAQGVPADAIRAVCVGSLYGGSGIPVDIDMRPLHPCLIWMDRRATAEVDWVNANVNVERLRVITGNGVDSYYGFTKMLWLRDQRPDVWANVRYFLPPNAYVIYLLTGEVAVDQFGRQYRRRVRRRAPRVVRRRARHARHSGDDDARAARRIDGHRRRAAVAMDGAARAAGTAVVAGGVDAAVATFAAGATRTGSMSG